MRGTMTVIEPESVSVTHLTAAPDLEVLQSAVGGWIEQVPGFTSFLDVETKQRVACVAFCNEEGKLKGLPFNGLATLAWISAIHADAFTVYPDNLVGAVVVLTGDAEFMGAL